MDTVAKEIMSKELIVGQDGISIEDAVKILINNKITGFPIVDTNGHMIGVLSEFDIIQQVTTLEKKTTSAKNFKLPATFSKQIISVKEDTNFEDVMNHFVKENVRRLPVVDAEGKIKGIITRRDVMRILYYRARLA